MTATVGQTVTVRLDDGRLALMVVVAAEHDADGVRLTLRPR